MKISVGDIVHVRGTVKEISLHCIVVEFLTVPSAPITRDQIVHIERRLQIGDRVRHKDGGFSGGEIVGISDGYAWVRWAEKHYETVKLCHLRRAQ